MKRLISMLLVIGYSPYLCAADFVDIYGEWEGTDSGEKFVVDINAGSYELRVGEVTLSNKWDGFKKQVNGSVTKNELIIVVPEIDDSEKKNTFEIEFISENSIKIGNDVLYRVEK